MKPNPQRKRGIMSNKVCVYKLFDTIKNIIDVQALDGRLGPP